MTPGRKTPSSVNLAQLELVALPTSPLSPAAWMELLSSAVFYIFVLRDKLPVPISDELCPIQSSCERFDRSATAALNAGK